MASVERQMIRRNRGRREHDPSHPHLAILIEHRPSGFEHVHAGIARYRQGTTLCSDRLLPVFGIPAEDPELRHLPTRGLAAPLRRGLPRAQPRMPRLPRDPLPARPRGRLVRPPITGALLMIAILALLLAGLLLIFASQTVVSATLLLVAGVVACVIAILCLLGLPAGVATWRRGP